MKVPSSFSQRLKEAVRSFKGFTCDEQAQIAHAYWRERQIVEGGGAVGIAALLAGKVPALGERIALVLSGRNVEMRRFTEIVTARAP